jgi:hypothetical protein
VNCCDSPHGNTGFGVVEGMELSSGKMKLSPLAIAARMKRSVPRMRIDIFHVSTALSSGNQSVAKQQRPLLKRYR